MANEGLHSGHRQRMREKFLDYGRDIFHSHELLEMFLFHAVPSKNTNPIAKNLLSRFTTLEGVFSAARDELLSVEGVGPKIADMILSVGKIDVFAENEETVKMHEEGLRSFEEALHGKKFIYMHVQKDDPETGKTIGETITDPAEIYERSVSVKEKKEK